jgi:hypothetical protein
LTESLLNGLPPLFDGELLKGGWGSMAGNQQRLPGFPEAALAASRAQTLKGLRPGQPTQKTVDGSLPWIVAGLPPEKGKHLLSQILRLSHTAQDLEGQAIDQAGVAIIKGR